MSTQTWAAWILNSYASSEVDLSDGSDTPDEDSQQQISAGCLYQHQYHYQPHQHQYHYHPHQHQDQPHPQRNNHSRTVSAPSNLMFQQQQQQSSPFGPYARTGRGGAGNYHWHSDPVRRPEDDIEAAAGLDMKQSSISERRQAAARLEQLQTAEALKSSQSRRVHSYSGRGGAGNYYTASNGGNEGAPSKNSQTAVGGLSGPRNFGRGGAGNLTAARDAKQRQEDEQLQSEQASAERTREEVELHVLRTLQTPPGAILGHSQRSNRLLNAV